MSPNEYELLAARTAEVDYRAIRDRLAKKVTMDLMHAEIGMCGEVGEAADIIKKHVYYGQALDKAHLAEELGDSLWYHALCCRAIGVTMEEVMVANIEKLRKRYPEQFTEELAAARLDKESGK